MKRINFNKEHLKDLWYGAPAVKPDPLYTDYSELRQLELAAREAFTDEEKLVDKSNQVETQRRRDNKKTLSILALTMVGAVITHSFFVSQEELKESRANAPVADMLFTDSEAVRNQVMSSPDVLATLGICALDLQAQLLYDDLQEGVSSQHALMEQRLDADRTALGIAKKHDISCTSEPEPVKVISPIDQSYIKISDRDVTLYDATAWCQIRNAVLAHGTFAVTDTISFVMAGEKAYRDTAYTINCPNIFG